MCQVSVGVQKFEDMVSYWRVLSLTESDSLMKIIMAINMLAIIRVNNALIY